MEQITKIFGGALFAGICILLMMTLVYGTQEEKGLLETGGELVEADWKEDSGAGFGSYGSESGEDFPEVAFTGGGALKTGTYRVADLFAVTAGNTGETQIMLLSVTDPGGNVNGDVKGQEEIAFPVSGIYTVCVRLSDAENRTVERQVKIPVNGGAA